MEEQIRQVRHELNTLHAEKTRGAKIRCKGNWGLNAERPTKYFLRLQKQNNQRKTLHRLINSEGRTLLDQNEILQEIRKYYEELYTSRGYVDYDYLDKIDFLQITTEMKKKLDRPIDLSEISQALREMKDNKSPGTDGLPADFYKVFYGRLKHFLHKLFLKIVDSGSMHLTARQGILSLLEKVDKNPLQLNS